ncbi:hypothetical protein BDP27DRAFT_1206961 [Rhodocollybia butyracea]|uniref:Uncharacterized protein n=1 Tax=Rhodocollybia butyracea TaxID=206335 RepID=A0A9P5UGL8_9AGAR|nr:hypothetical protein BDP27DRAFT_1206961 [Rhodocollybia butyracea]
MAYFTIEEGGYPPCYDEDGVSPVFFASAIFGDYASVQPCKSAPHISPTPCSVPYGGQEVYHEGAFEVLRFDPETMELVGSSNGEVPWGRNPVGGGWEEDGRMLYHGLAEVNGVRIPGKTAPHLGGCNVSFGGEEVQVTEGYEVL